MSVKRKFRKSKKGKGKTKDNNKHKNNEKRSKIQRKTKKRVLRGGRRDPLCPPDKVVHSQLTDFERFRGKKITLEKCDALKTDILDKQSRCLTDKAKKEVMLCGINIEELLTQNPVSIVRSVEEAELLGPALATGDTSTDLEAAETEVQAAETETDEEREQRLAATAEARVVEEAARKSEKIKEAEDQVEKDSEVQTEEILNDSNATLELSQRHEALANKYKNLEEIEEDSEIKEIYSNAKIYHNFASSRLEAISMEQKEKEIETEQANTSPVVGALQPPISNVETQQLQLRQGDEGDDGDEGDLIVQAELSKQMLKAIQEVKIPRTAPLIEQKGADLVAINKAVGEITLDLNTSTEKIPNNSDETLILAGKHCDLVAKYERLVNTEQNYDVKQMYIVAKDYHTSFCEKLRQEADLQKLEALEAQTQAPAGPKIVDELKLFPNTCFGKYSICKKKLNELENQSYFCYQFFKRMKDFFIKQSTSIVFDDLLSSENVPPFSASLNFFELYLNFFEFYNEHMASDDEKKKIIVKRQEDGKVITSNDDKGKPNIVMEQYPEIDLKTFFDNCYKLYELSLSQVCSFRLAESAYDTEKFKRDFDDSRASEMKNMLDTFTPTIFTPTSIEQNNLKTIIYVLQQHSDQYTKLNAQSIDKQVFLDLTHYNAILPSGSDFVTSILSVPRDTDGYSLLDFIEFIANYQLLYPRYSSICVAFGDTTRNDIRKNVQAMFLPGGGIDIQVIQGMVDNGSIFTSTCPFIAENAGIKTEIIKLIKGNNEKITNPSWMNFPTPEERNCAIRSASQILTELENPSKNFKTNFFFHMIIFACYHTYLQENRWGIQGTTLMMLYMNIFIIKFFNNILQSVNTSCSTILANAHVNGFILIDKNVFTLLEYIKILKEHFLSLKIKKKTKNTFHLEEERTIALYDEFERIQERIKERNSEQVTFIEGLNGYYTPESTESVQSTQKKTKLREMNDYNLRAKMIELCKTLKEKVENIHDTKYPGKSELQENPQLAVTSDVSVMFDYETLNKSQLTKIKDECKEFVVSLISVARAKKANKYFDENNNNISSIPLHYSNEQLIQLNRCCDPRDVFNKGKNSREHNKRIARAFYGLSEIWPYIDEIQKPVILQLPGVDALIQKFNTDESFRNLVKNQCNDDGKAEKKFGVRWWGKSESRTEIRGDMTDEVLKSTCEDDFVRSPLKMSTKPEPVSAPQRATQQETPEETAARLKDAAARQRAQKVYAKDLAEAAADNAKKYAEAFKITPTEVEANLISDAQRNLEIIDKIIRTTSQFSIPTAIKAIEQFKNSRPLLYTIALTRHTLKIPRDKQISADQLAREYAESRKVINHQIEEGTYKPPTTIFGGTTLTKTKHKSNHKSKAKTQSKPKHKNKSKPKHRTKAKTIKKNKRAHHKFDKKYTRKR